MEDKSLKITVEHSGETISLSSDKPNLHFDDFMEMLKTIAGHIYTQELWDNYWKED